MKFELGKARDRGHVLVGLAIAVANIDEFIHIIRSSKDPTEARELVVDAWRMVVPKKLSLAYDLAHPDGPGRALETAQPSSASTSAEA